MEIDTDKFEPWCGFGVISPLTINSSFITYDTHWLNNLS